MPESNWTEEPHYAKFRKAYDYATSHFSTAAHAHAKITREDAYRIWNTIQLGMEREDQLKDEPDARF